MFGSLQEGQREFRNAAALSRILLYGGQSTGQLSQFTRKRVTVILGKRHAQACGYGHLMEIIREASENGAFQVFFHAFQGFLITPMPAINH